MSIKTQRDLMATGLSQFFLLCKAYPEERRTNPFLQEMREVLEELGLQVTRGDLKAASEAVYAYMQDREDLFNLNNITEAPSKTQRLQEGKLHWLDWLQGADGPDEPPHFLPPHTDLVEVLDRAQDDVRPLAPEYYLVAALPWLFAAEVGVDHELLKPLADLVTKKTFLAVSGHQKSGVSSFCRIVLGAPSGGSAVYNTSQSNVWNLWKYPDLYAVDLPPRGHRSLVAKTASKVFWTYASLGIFMVPQPESSSYNLAFRQYYALRPSTETFYLASQSDLIFQPQAIQQECECDEYGIPLEETEAMSPEDVASGALVSLRERRKEQRIGKPFYSVAVAPQHLIPREFLTDVDRYINATYQDWLNDRKNLEDKVLLHKASACLCLDALIPHLPGLLDRVPGLLDRVPGLLDRDPGLLDRVLEDWTQFMANITYPYMKRLQTNSIWRELSTMTSSKK